MESVIREIKNKEEFDQMVKAEKGLVVVDFWAKWCGPCKTIAPQFLELAQNNINVVFAKADIDVIGDELVDFCGIESMPTFKFYVSGKESATVEGADIDDVVKKVSELKPAEAVISSLPQL